MSVHDLMLHNDDFKNVFGRKTLSSLKSKPVKESAIQVEEMRETELIGDRAKNKRAGFGRPDLLLLLPAHARVQ